MAKHTKSLPATQRKIRKLQRAGILSPKIDPTKKPSKYVLAKFDKYRGVLSGRQAAVRLSSEKKAAEYRRKIGEGGQGKTVLITREKGERFRVVDDTIKSKRTAYGQTIDKVVGDKFDRPKTGEKVYYTLPRQSKGKIFKRRTFASYDELLFFLNSSSGNGYSFDDLKTYIEVERFKEGSRNAKRVQKEYNSARSKLERARVKANKKTKTKRGKRK